MSLVSASFRLRPLAAKGILCLSLLIAAASRGHAATPAAVTPLPDDPACTAEDRKYMARAYELAEIATSRGNSPYGALIVKDGEVLAEFSNDAISSHDVTHHAETGLISMSSRKFDKKTFAACTLYTSTEPCIMCCGSINFAGVKRIVYGTTAIQVTRLHGRTLPIQPLQIREVYTRMGATSVTILGPLMEEQGLAVHAAAMLKATAPKPATP